MVARVPIYDCDRPLDKLREWEQTHRCACGAALSVAWGGAFAYNGYILRCTRDVGHDNIVRPSEPSVYEKAQGGNMSTAIQRYSSRVKLTRPEANELLAELWPKATEQARYKAAAIAFYYGLNPALGHIHLVGYTNRQTGETEWVVMLSIETTRIFARRAGPYGYLDDTPRLATKEEQEKVWGKAVDPAKYVACVTRVKDIHGHIFSGFGLWKLDVAVKGADKGNTPHNMAMIRSERQALKRMCPEALPPTDVPIYDAEYSLVPDAEDLWPEGTPPEADEENEEVTPGEVVRAIDESEELAQAKGEGEANQQGLPL